MMSTSPSKVQEKDIILAIKQVYDPDVPVNIYDLGLIYDIQMDREGEVFILMTFTSPNCPMADFVLKELHDEVAQVPGIHKVEIEVTFEPPWDKSRLSEAALLELGLL